MEMATVIGAFVRDSVSADMWNPINNRDEWRRWILWDIGWGAAIVIFFAATVARGRLGRNGLRLTHYGGHKPQSGHYIKGFYVTQKHYVIDLGAMLASFTEHREFNTMKRGGGQDVGIIKN